MSLDRASSVLLASAAAAGIAVLLKSRTSPGSGAFASLAWNTAALARGSLLAAVFARLVSAPAWRRSTLHLSPRAAIVFHILAVHESLWLLVNGFFLALDRRPLTPHPFSKYKLPRQEGQLPSEQLIRATVLKQAVSHAIAQPPALWLVAGHVANLQAMPAPKFGQLWRHLAVCQLLESLLFYVSHRALHTSFLYAKVHKQHHRYTGSIGFAAEHAHPVEQLFGNYLPVLAGPAVLQPEFHPSALVAWLAWRLLATYERHSGYDFSSTPLGRLGLLHGNGCRFHDHHHTTGRDNYGSGLDFFDALAGTRKSTPPVRLESW